MYKPSFEIEIARQSVLNSETLIWFSVKSHSMNLKLYHLSQILGMCPWFDKFSSVQFSFTFMSDSLWPHELQHARPSYPSPTPRFYPNSCPLSRWCHPAISSSVSPSPPALNPSQYQGLFQWVNSSHEVAKVLEFQLSHHSLQRNPRADLLQNGLVGSPCSPRNSQESSPTPQFKSITSWTLSLLHSPTLTSIHDHRKNHSLD